MALKQFIVPLDDTVEGLGALRFVLRNFGFEKNIVNILWFGSRCVQPEKAVDVRLANSMAKLDPINGKYRQLIKKVLETEFPEIHTNINVITIDKITRKQLTNYCNYADSLFSTFLVYLNNIYPLYKDYTVGKKYAKICCPKVLMSSDLDKVENVVLVKTDQVNTIATVKQFCNVYSEKCEGKELNLLDLQEFSERGGAFNSQRMLVDYLKNHVSSPAIYPYSDEEPEKLANILNFNSNTIWVSALESVEEVKFISKKV